MIQPVISFISWYFCTHLHGSPRYAVFNPFEHKRSTEAERFLTIFSDFNDMRLDFLIINFLIKKGEAGKKCETHR